MRSRSRSDRRLADARHGPDGFAEGLDDLPEGGKPANPELLSLHRGLFSASGTFLGLFSDMGSDFDLSSSLWRSSHRSSLSAFIRARGGASLFETIPD